jgi:phenylpropionate dioxygenase-like ring-hydroxylating dioxygenase large terminal subunit
MTQLQTTPVVMARPTVVHQPAPLAPGRITAERYTSPAFLAREAQDLWPRTWLFACWQRDVSLPGQYSVLNIGRESIVVSRGDDGSLNAFYNVCQHRGARLMANPRSRVKSFVCPYHGWTYDRTGALVHVPDPERFPGGIDCAANSLKRVQVEAWCGLVFVNMDLAAPPLRQYFAGVAEALEPYRIQDMELVGDQTVHLDCNWKAVFDNFGELYHVEHIHPQHAQLFDCSATGTRASSLMGIA